MKPKIAIIGAGAAGLSFATKINTDIYAVQLFEKKNRIGSKLLVAGKGGFNLSHSEDIEILKTRYQPLSILEQPLTYFNNNDLRTFFADIGVQTFIGSSKRIFPEPPMKPVEVLNAIQTKIIDNGVSMINNAEWIALDKHQNTIDLSFSIDNQTVVHSFDYVIFALGGASWTVTGSTGDWLEKFKELDIITQPFEASNCAVSVPWATDFIKNYAGTPLKNITVSIDDFAHKGEVMLTEFGLEGTPIYALSKNIRRVINQNVNPTIFINLKPTLDIETLVKKLRTPQKGSWTKHIEKQLNLSKVQMALLKSYTSKEDFQSIEKLVNIINQFPIEIVALAPIEEAISTVGGVATTEVNDQFELKNCKHVFVIGEMLDWDAPTGGYLIQGCMSMGQYLANYFNQLK